MCIYNACVQDINKLTLSASTLYYRKTENKGKNCTCCLYTILPDKELEMGINKNVIACGQSLNENINFDFYKTLFDPVRSDILIYLVSYGKKNIKAISEKFTQDRSVISKHLDLMRRYGIVLKEKQGRNVYYEVNSNFIIEQFEKTTANIKKSLKLAKQKAK
jgi:DNA-binding transcriptional ArsR family regulator